jgi:hypothetical protein
MDAWREGTMAWELRPSIAGTTATGLFLALTLVRFDGVRRKPSQKVAPACWPAPINAATPRAWFEHDDLERIHPAQRRARARILSRWWRCGGRPMVLRNFSLTRLIALCAAGAIALASAPASAWEFAHGNRDNSGFANVATAPAGKGSVSVPGLGRFSPGAGPVVAPDGTVYLGTNEGKLIALHADGSPFWSRDIQPGQSIVASPAIASDGSIYVIGVRTVRDNRVDPPVTTVTSTLHHFNNTGAWLNQIAFPAHEESGPAAFGPPNIWRSGSAEAIMVTALYRHKYGGGHTVRLIAFSLTGQVLDDKVVISIAPQVVGGSGRPSWMDLSCLAPVVGWGVCLGASPYTPPPSGALLVKTPPAPGVGIFTFAGGGTPFILVSDHYKDLVGFTFSNQQLTEIFRVHDNDGFMRTPPMILPDGHTVIGVQGLERDNMGAELPVNGGRIAFAGPNGNKIAPVALDITTQAVPTRMADSRVAVVEGSGKVVILKDGKPFSGMNGAGRSIASAAASQTHLFVSGEDGFVTYDANSLAEVARFDWVGGGLNPPAIGPKGHVYAIASNILFVFPPPKPGMGTTVRQPQSGVTVATNPDPATTNPQEKIYDPPLTANGNRLFACEELDQDDCGKGDHRDIAKAFCAKQGFTQADDIDVDSRKVKAETLNGQFCSKNKCKVFDKIVCKM